METHPGYGEVIHGGSVKKNQVGGFIKTKKTMNSNEIKSVALWFLVFLILGLSFEG
jgi:hypothetical protein